MQFLHRVSDLREIPLGTNRREPEPSSVTDADVRLTLHVWFTGSSDPRSSGFKVRNPLMNNSREPEPSSATI